MMAQGEILTHTKKIGIRRAIDQLDERYEAHLVNFFDEDASAIIQGTVEDLITHFPGL